MPVSNVIAVRIEQDIRGTDQGFHLGFPLVRVRAETLLGDGKAVLRILGHAQLQMAPAVGGQLPAIVP